MGFMRTRSKPAISTFVGVSGFWFLGAASADTLFNFTQQTISPGGATDALLDQSFTVGSQRPTIAFRDPQSYA